MIFLSPLYLFLSAAAAVPLLVHLLRRRTGLRVEFPAARYLARAEREHSRNLRVRNLLLMLLRVAAVVFVALAAARPLGPSVGRGHAPTAVAVVLDNSLSSAAISGGRPVLDELREAAGRVARSATPADRVWLITASGRITGGSGPAVGSAAERAEALPGAGDVPAAVNRAAALVGSAPPAYARSVVVLTDGQATTWRRRLDLGEVHAAVLVPARNPPMNHGVTRAEATPPRWTPGGTVTARVTGRDSSTYRVTLAGRTLARGVAVAPAGAGSVDVVVRATPPERGWQGGTVELEPDELRGDDVRSYAVWIGAAPRVSVDSTAGPFVTSAVAALAQDSQIAVGSGVSIVPADRLGSRPALIVAPSDPVRLGAANRALERAGIPWRFGGARRGDAPVRGDRLAGVVVSLRYALVASGASPSDTLASVGGQPGEPWVVAGDGYVLVASPLDPSATTLPVRAAFVPWLADLLTQRLAGRGGGILSSAPGASIRRPGWAEALVGPMDTPTPLRGDTIVAPPRPGVYMFERAGERVGALVVNPEPEESVLERLSPAGLLARLHAARAVAVQDADRLRAAAFDAGERRPLVLSFLIAAAMALLAESWVRRTPGGDALRRAA